MAMGTKIPGPPSAEAGNFKQAMRHSRLNLNCMATLNGLPATESGTHVTCNM